MPDSFNSGTPDATTFVAPGVAPTVVDTSAEDKTVLLELNGRKFTKADLVAKIVSGDQFIETLKAESKTQRELLEKATDALTKSVSAAEVLKAVQNPPATVAIPTNATSPIAPTAAEIIAEVERLQLVKQSAAQQDTNWKETTTTLTKVFGDKVDVKVDEVCARNGLTRQAAIVLAKSTPKVFLALFPEISAPSPKTIDFGNRSVNTQAQTGDTSRKASGILTAKSSKDHVAVYKRRLAELGIE